MTATTTLTLRLPVELKERLGRIATATRRSQSFLAAEALSAYVDHELAIIADIQQGLAEVAAGEGIPHDEVMDEIDALIAEAQAHKA